MRAVDLARPRSLHAPGLDELAVLGKLHDARIGVAAVAIGNEDVAIGSRHHGGRRVELVVAGARDAGLAEREQDLAVRAELEHLMALPGLAGAIGEPDVAFTVDMN